MFKLSMWNAWLLSLPFFTLDACFMGLNRDIGNRMSDMSGIVQEKSFLLL